MLKGSIYDHRSKSEKRFFLSRERVDRLKNKFLNYQYPKFFIAESWRKGGEMCGIEQKKNLIFLGISKTVNDTERVTINERCGNLQCIKWRYRYDN